MRRLFFRLVILALLTGTLLAGIILFQQTLTRKEHIAPAPRLADIPHRVQLKHSDGTMESVTIQYVDDTLVAAHGGMGNEIEEQLTLLLALNLVTFALLATLCFVTLRLMPPWTLRSPAWMRHFYRRRQGFEVVMPRGVQHP